MATKVDYHVIFRIIAIVLAIFVLFALITYYNSKQSSLKASTEKFYQDLAQSQPPFQAPSPAPRYQAPALAHEKNPLLIDTQDKAKAEADSVDPSEEKQNSDFRAVDFNGNANKLPSDCFPRDRLAAEDLLPGDAAANSKWAQVNPAGQGDVSNQNFLTAGWAVGINTVGSTLRNSNLGLRSEPPNPRGSWPINNSTIDNSDIMRRPLEIGENC
jgi:hypothetical protein